MHAGTRALLCDTGGGWAQIAPPGFWLTTPPYTHEKIFHQEKNEIHQTGPKLEVDFRYTNFFWPLTPPPPQPRYSINQPLSKGLAGTLEKCDAP